VDRVAQVQAEDLMDVGDPHQRLPDAVGDSFAGALDGFGGSVRNRWRAPLRIGGYSDQLCDVKGLAGLTQQEFEIAQPLGILQPYHRLVVGDRPVISFATKDRRAVCPVEH
jgi:hypothetical protein